MSLHCREDAPLSGSLLTCPQCQSSHCCEGPCGGLFNSDSCLVQAVRNASSSRLRKGQPGSHSNVRSVLQEFGAKGSFIQYGGVADHALVVRGITTVFNTDYITDVTFHLNGAIKVGVLPG